MRNINFNATEEDIREFLQDCGEIERIYLPQTGNLVLSLRRPVDSVTFILLPKKVLKRLWK